MPPAVPPWESTLQTGRQPWRNARVLKELQPLYTGGSSPFENNTSNREIIQPWPVDVDSATKGSE
jgi:hypothetical protein